MDKNEQLSKIEELKVAMREKDYELAASIADQLEIKKIKDNNVLTMIADAYEMISNYEQAKKVLLMAYENTNAGRQLAYRLCLISVKNRDFYEAEEFYEDFIEMAPRDTSRYILKYKMAQGQNLPVEDLIPILEEYVNLDMEEKWAYELAKLYKAAGEKDKCLSLCNEIGLWFAEGKYVSKAKELANEVKNIPEKAENSNQALDAKADSNDENKTVENIEADTEKAMAELFGELEEDTEQTITEQEDDTENITEQEDIEHVIEQENNVEQEDATEQEDQSNEIVEDTVEEIASEAAPSNETKQAGVNIYEKNIDNSGMVELFKSEDDKMPEESEKAEELGETKISDKLEVDDTENSESLDVEEGTQDDLDELPDEVSDEDIDDINSNEGEKDVQYILRQLQERGILKAETVEQAFSIIEQAQKKEEEPVPQVSAFDVWAADNVEEPEEELSNASQEAEEEPGNASQEADAEDEMDGALQEADAEDEMDGALQEADAEDEMDGATQEADAEDEMDGALQEADAEDEMDGATQEADAEDEMDGALQEADAEDEMDGATQEADAEDEMDDASQEAELEELGVMDDFALNTGENLDAAATAKIPTETITKAVEDPSDIMFRPTERIPDAKSLLEAISSKENNIINSIGEKAASKAEKAVDPVETKMEDVPVFDLGGNMSVVEELADNEENPTEADLNSQSTEEIISDTPVNTDNNEELDISLDSPIQINNVAEQINNVAEQINNVAEQINNVAEQINSVAEARDEKTAAEESVSVTDDIEESVNAIGGSIQESDESVDAKPGADEENILKPHINDKPEDKIVMLSDDGEQIQEEESIKEVQPAKAFGSIVPKQPVAEEVTEKPNIYITDEEMAVFKNYLNVEGLESTIKNVVFDLIKNFKQDGKSTEGNIIITGENQTGKTTLAIEIIKLVNKKRGRRDRKLAKIKAPALSKRGFRNSLGKLLGCDLIIEDAHLLGPMTISEIIDVAGSFTDDMIIVLEGNANEMQTLIDNSARITEVFNHTIMIKEYDIKEWVEYGEKYANEKGYSLDELAKLALFKAIDDSFGINKGIGQSEVENIVDSAIERSNRLGKKISGIFSSKKDDEGLQILKEADFNI